MICPRCGTVQRRETARFCHQCGTTFEPAPTSAQADNNEVPVSESAQAELQDDSTLTQPTYTPPEPAEQPVPEEELLDATQPPQPPVIDYPNWQEEAPTALSEPSRASPDVYRYQPPAAPKQPVMETLPRWEPAAPPPSRPQDYFPPMPGNKAFTLEPPPAAFTPPPGDIRSAAPAPAWRAEAPVWDRQPPQAPVEEVVAVRSRPVSPAQNVQSRPRQPSFEGRAETPSAWQTPAAEPPTRSAARGPVPGAFQRPRPVKRRRVPLGVIISLALLLVFVVAGLGIYAFASGSVSQEPSAFVSYTDPGNHFKVRYPNVWNVKALGNGARFADATNTAELSITYTPNSSNLTAEQFADQEAAKENISTPDTQTFAGTTWVQRSGIVTQTSGISQDIFIFVTVSNNLLYEVREVAPLDGYKEPNQAAFMPMLQSLTLM